MSPDMQKLVDALCVVISGYTNDPEGKRYHEAFYLVRAHAKRLHLEAELKELNERGAGG